MTSLEKQFKYLGTIIEQTNLESANIYSTRNSLVESIVSFNVTALYGNLSANSKNMLSIVDIAGKVIGTETTLDFTVNDLWCTLRSD